jgi:competence protein ComEC
MIARLLRRRLHVSWMIAFTCVGLSCGIILSSRIELGTFSSVAWLLTGTSLILFGCLRGKAWVVPLVVLGGFLVGGWRASAILIDSTAYEHFLHTNVEVSGFVKEDSDINQRGQTVLRLGTVSLGENRLPGDIWVTTARTERVMRSDLVHVTGRLSEGFGNFSASMYSARLDMVERPIPGDIALGVRNWFADGVRRAVPDPQSSLGLGFLVGQRRGLPEDMDAALKAAGLTHIVVASGYNLTILVRLARRLFLNISKYLSLIASTGMIGVFVAITGSSPSMSRAGLVAGLSLAAWYYGRRFHPLVLLPFAMAITLIIQPSYGWGDLGWQLSFAAFAGVMITAPLVQSYFYGDKKENQLRRIMIETISAQVWTLPILLVAFGQFSAVAPFANILILPLVPLAMLLTFVAGAGALLVPAASIYVGLPAELVLTYMTSTTEIIGGLSWALQDIQVSALISGLMYAMIIGFTAYMWYRTRLALERTSLIE